ncbi:hypothetical protein N7507_007079 [Penicillium longicatenatum]|nr:hypothetical protein N7507_007079 [Penicillium longicatenatum]
MCMGRDLGGGAQNLEVWLMDSLKALFDKHLSRVELKSRPMTHIKSLGPMGDSVIGVAGR